MKSFIANVDKSIDNEIKMAGCSITYCSICFMFGLLAADIITGNVTGISDIANFTDKIQKTSALDVITSLFAYAFYLSMAMNILGRLGNYVFVDAIAYFKQRAEVINAG